VLSRYHEVSAAVASATAAYLENLNPEQRHAVEHGAVAPGPFAPLLVIAGAGSGKTNTLAHRGRCRREGAIAGAPTFQMKRLAGPNTAIAPQQTRVLLRLGEKRILIDVGVKRHFRHVNGHSLGLNGIVVRSNGGSMPRVSQTPSISVKKMALQKLHSNITQTIACG
jgi:hypothetical protein